MTDWRRTLPVVAIGTAAGYGLSLTPLPMPWLIGPMLVATFGAIRNGRLALPGWVRPGGQLVVACFVGLAFTRPAFNVLIDQLPIMIFVSAATVLAAFLAAVVLVRLSGIDPISATIASVPGGPVEMSVFAEAHGVPPAPVALVQTLRITLLVVTVPPLLLLASGKVPDARAALSSGPLDPGAALLLLLLALGGAILFNLLRLTSPWFLGALAVSASATVLGLPVSAPPFWLLCAAQVLLGMTLGNMFDRSLLVGMRRFLLASCASTAVLVTLTVALALGISAATGIPVPTMVLATAPGGVTEMALTAKLLQQDAALVTAFHLVRIFTIMPFAPLLFAGAARIAHRLGPKDEKRNDPEKDP